jgi:hypothetical protein
MSEVKHTPGPWVVIPRGESSGKSVGTIEPKPQTMTSVNYWTVAEVNGLRDEWEANLCLIAAAPELLEALQECKQLLDMVLCVSGGLPPEANGPAAKALAAIAKATGQ